MGILPGICFVHRSNKKGKLCFRSGDSFSDNGYAFLGENKGEEFLLREKEREGWAEPFLVTMGEAALQLS